MIFYSLFIKSLVFFCFKIGECTKFIHTWAYSGVVPFSVMKMLCPTYAGPVSLRSRTAKAVTGGVFQGSKLPPPHIFLNVEQTFIVNVNLVGILGQR